MAQNRARNWCFVINGEKLPTIEQIFEKMTEIKAKNYAFIYHNKDELKREHIHIVVEFENARDFNSLQKKLETWHIEKCKSIASAIQYLTHKNAPSKEQYTTNDVSTNNEQWYSTLNNLQQDYVNDEKELIQDILNGKFTNIFEIIISEKYSMEWLQRRYKMVEELFFALKKEEWKSKI